ncbi:MAG: Veg family protein [Defluviitaleaceae bacterium]|nr:Veg family protein [Defluviitaleaceae bacterium]
MRGRVILAKSILDIRNELNNHIGKPVKLVAYESRNRMTKKAGTLSSIYPSVFVVEIGEDQDSVDRVSYNYIDILTGSVELEFE